MLVQVRYRQLQKYVKLEEVEGRFDFVQFDLKVKERFCLPPDAAVTYKDATGTDVDPEIFSDLAGLGNVVLTVFSNDEFSDSSTSASEISDCSSSSNASTLILDEAPSKRPRIEETSGAVSAKQLVEAVLRSKSGGQKILNEYQTTETLTDGTRRDMVNILVSHIVDNHEFLPTKATREEYALGIVMLFPSLKDPYSKKGYEQFYDAQSNTGFIAWRLKTVKRKSKQSPGSAPSPNSSTAQSPGGPTAQRVVNTEEQLDGDACKEAMSLLNHTTDNSQIFQKMRQTFQHRQKLVNDPSKGDVLAAFPRFLDTKGLVEQDFVLLFNEDISSQLLKKWDSIFKEAIIKEASKLTATPEVRRLVQSAESPPGSDPDDATIYDPEMASLLLLLHLLPPPPGGPKSHKVSACDAVERLVVFHKSCCSLEEQLRNQKNAQPYLLAVGRQKSKIDSFYIVLDHHLIPCQANGSLGAFDELFKAHFVFNVSYDAALVSFYTFLQTTVYNIDVGK